MINVLQPGKTHDLKSNLNYKVESNIMLKARGVPLRRDYSYRIFEGHVLQVLLGTPQMLHG